MATLVVFLILTVFIVVVCQLMIRLPARCCIRQAAFSKLSGAFSRVFMEQTLLTKKIFFIRGL